MKKQRKKLILLSLFVAVWTQRVHIHDFFEGAFQGYSMNSANHIFVE